MRIVTQVPCDDRSSALLQFARAVLLLLERGAAGDVAEAQQAIDRLVNLSQRNATVR